ncbi:MAG TPA: glutathione S-transferase [Bradyrhizobium sp.]|nr:glutathione S-transferase [Bradyrhizobium sp.]
MKLYHWTLSGHSHRARLFLALLGVKAELIEPPANGNTSPEFLKLNPFGQLPVLVDGDVVVTDSTAILVYLAKKNQRRDWLPESPAEAAAVQKWLSVAANEIANGPCAARLVTVFGVPLNATEAIARAHRVLGLVEQALEGRRWIATDNPTIADVALYSYISHAPEGNVDIAGYSNIAHWLKRVESLPGFLPFPQTAAGLRAGSSAA